MKSLTKIQKNEITNLYEMLLNGWHYTNHPMHYKFMQSHNELPNYKS